MTCAQLIKHPADIQAYDQIKEAVSKTVEIIEGISILGPSDFENVTYPVETLHEIITNAVLHRDYSIADAIHVRIFDNRIEVESPDRFAGARCSPPRQPKRSGQQTTC